MVINKLVAFSVAVFAAAVVAAQPIQQNQNQKTPAAQGEVVRLKTDLLRLHAVVTDKQGRIIDNLTKEDFELSEQGVSQNISFFSHEHIASGPVDKPASERNPIEVGKPMERSVTPLRSIVLFVDVLHLSAPSLIRAKQTLKQFVDERMTDQDVVLLVTSSGVSSGFEQFTQDKQLLHHLIDRIALWQMSRESRFTPYLAGSVEHGDNDAVQLGRRIMEGEDGMSMDGLPPSMIRQMVEGKAREVLAQAEYGRRALLSVLRAVADGLSTLPGQRLILLLSDGFTLMDNGGGSDTSDLQGAISKAVRAGVRIYSLDAKGLQAPAEFDASLPSVSLTGNLMGLLSSYMSASDKDLQDGMNALASDTGGKFFHNTNDLKGSLQSAIDDNRDYYELSYYPSDFKDNRPFRRISVRIRNHPEYKVRAQSGYLVSDFRKEDPKENARAPEEKLARAIASPLPVTAIRVGATASHLEADADAAQVSLQAWIDGTGLTYREQGGRVQIDLQVATVVYDRFGKVVSTASEVIRGGFSAEQLEPVKRTGFRYTKRIAAKPGRYQIRIGVSDSSAGHIGTAITWVEVPRLGTGKLILSNIILAEDSDERQKRSNGESGGGINPWAGIRYFTRNTFLVYQLMIYNALSRDAETGLVIQREITQFGKVIYQSPQEPLASRLTGREKKGMSIGGKIQLGMDPGIYEMRISVTDTKSKKTTQQAVTFGIAR